MIRPRNLLDVSSDAIFSTSEPKLFGALAELDVRVDLGHLFPRDANAAAPADPGGDPPEQSAPGAPHSGPAKNRDQLEILAGPALEREIVDLPAAPALGVEQLVIEDVEPEVDRVAQFWPTFVRIMSGTAVRAITVITTRYSSPRMFPTRPFVYSRM